MSRVADNLHGVRVATPSERSVEEGDCEPTVVVLGLAIAREGHAQPEQVRAAPAVDRERHRRIRVGELLELAVDAHLVRIAAPGQHVVSADVEAKRSLPACRALRRAETRVVIERAGVADAPRPLLLARRRIGSRFRCDDRARRTTRGGGSSARAGAATAAKNEGETQCQEGSRPQNHAVIIREPRPQWEHPGRRPLTQ